MSTPHTQAQLGDPDYNDPQSQEKGQANLLALKDFLRETGHDSSFNYPLKKDFDTCHRSTKNEVLNVLASTIEGALSTISPNQDNGTKIWTALLKKRKVEERLAVDAPMPELVAIVMDMQTKSC